MTFSSDDLASVLLAPDREFAGYGQAILTSFDTETFENEVNYRGAIFTNLPVMSGTEALTYQAGDVVLLMKWRPTGKGLGSYWIAGRPVVPASGRAEEAIGFLTTTLAESISAQAFAARIHTATIPTQENTTSATFTDLATVGPQVTDVNIEVGTAIVFASAGIFVQIDADQQGTGGFMGVQISGATSVSPEESESLVYAMFPETIPGDPGINGFLRAANVYPFTGLNPGVHTFTAKYRRYISGGQAIEFIDRAMVVIGF